MPEHRALLHAVGVCAPVYVKSAHSGMMPACAPDSLTALPLHGDHIALAHQVVAFMGFTNYKHSIQALRQAALDRSCTDARLCKGKNASWLLTLP